MYGRAVGAADDCASAVCELFRALLLKFCLFILLSQHINGLIISQTAIGVSEQLQKVSLSPDRRGALLATEKHLIHVNLANGTARVILAKHPLPIYEQAFSYRSYLSGEIIYWR